jgi:hypothetical protein
VQITLMLPDGDGLPDTQVGTVDSKRKSNDKTKEIQESFVSRSAPVAGASKTRRANNTANERGDQRGFVMNRQ